MKYKALIFDCDGVVFDSNKMKTENFREITTPVATGQQVEQFLRYHIENGGTSRYAKIRHLVTNILGKDFDRPLYDALVAQFAEKTRAGYLTVPFTAGFEAIIRSLHNRIALFVASGSDENELRDVFDHRGLSPYFAEVLGSPRKKKDLLRYILVNYELSPEKVLFIGDAPADLAAAGDSGVDFIFMKRYSESFSFLEQELLRSCITVIDDLEDLREKIDQ